MARKPSRNRGYFSRRGTDGLKVIMFVDDPGNYVDVNGESVTVKAARAAGFDVDRDLKDRARMKLRTNYEQRIQQRFAEAENHISEILERDPETLSALRVVQKGAKGNYTIVDGDGDPIVSQPMNHEEALVLYSGVTGEEWMEDAETVPVVKNPYLEMSDDEILDILDEKKVTPPKDVKGDALALFAMDNIGLPVEDDDGPGGKDPDDLVG